MAVKLTDFSNDKYLVLKALFDHQVQVGSETYVPLSQSEIAVVVGFAKPKTNQLMQELVSEGYITLYKGIRGKYMITTAGLQVVNIFEN